MSNDNEVYDSRISGDYYTKQIRLTNDNAIPLANYERSLYVNVIVPDTNFDGDPNNDVYMGDSNGQWRTRGAGSESGRMPVDNLNKIWIRNKVAGSNACVFVEVFPPKQ